MIMSVMSTSWILDFAVCSFIALLLLYLYMTRNFNYWQKRNVREIRPVILFGSVTSCLMGRENPSKFLSDAYKKGEGEKMIGIYVLDKPYLVLRSPELIRDVFVKDFNNFSNKILSNNSTDVFGGKNIFMITNPPWKQIRQKLTPIFTSGKLKNMFELTLEICQDFDVYMENLRIDDKVGKPVEIKDVCAKFMTDMIGTTAFGIKFNSLTNPNAEFRKHGKTMFRSSYLRYLQMLSIFFVPALRSITNAQYFDNEGSKFMRRSFWDVIDERMRTGIKRPDLIEVLIEIIKNQENDNSDSYKLEGDDLVAQAAIFFTGGFETTSTTVVFAFYELAKNLTIQQRLRNEILDGLKKNNGKITYEMVTTLPYLNMVTHEALRMYPVIPFLDRVADERYTFSGTNVTIDKGTPVFLPVRAVHMDPKYYPNPDSFDPERFSEANKNNIVPFTFFPFGEGPRNCMGARLGLIQTKLVLICFLSKYEMTFCQKTPNPMKLDNLNVFTHLLGDLYLNLTKISS